MKNGLSCITCSYETFVPSAIIEDRWSTGN
jgi:hypothetical protein